MVKKMAERPLILALANPEPEILPGAGEGGAPRLRHRHRALGLSEPGQQRAVLPVHLPRRARRRRDHHQHRDGARRGARHRRARAGRDLRAGGARLRHRVPISFGPEYIIPQAVRPAPDRARSRRRWRRRRWTRAWRRGRSPTSTPTAPRSRQFVYHSGLIMKPLFTAAKAAPRRIVYAEGEDERVLRAAQIVVDEGLARPMLIGRPQVIEQRLERLGLRVRAGQGIRAGEPGVRPALPRLLDHLPPAQRAQGRVRRSTRASRCAAAPR